MTNVSAEMAKFLRQLLWGLTGETVSPNLEIKKCHPQEIRIIFTDFKPQHDGELIWYFSSSLSHLKLPKCLNQNVSSRKVGILSIHSPCFPLFQAGWVRALALVPGCYLPMLGGHVISPIPSLNSVCISKSPNTRSSCVVYFKIGGATPVTFFC